MRPAGDDYRLSVQRGAAVSGPGETRPAGEGVSDEEMAREVAGQTSSDLKADDVFEREADGAAGDTEAAKADPDELPG
jgi:deglycase